MARTETELLNDLQTVSLQDLINVGLNAWAIQLTIESYQAHVKRFGRTDKIQFAWDGVLITIEAFAPAGENKDEESVGK